MFRFLTCAVLVFGLAAPAEARTTSRAASDPSPLVNEAVAPSVVRDRENFTRIHEPITVLEQLSGLFFEWKHGGERDLDCFVAGDLSAIPPEVLVWELPGEIVTGVDYNRLAPIFIEAIKSLECQVEDCYRLLQSLAEKFEDLDETVTAHGSRLESQQSSICALQVQVSEQQTSLTAQQQRIEVLEQQNLRLEAEIAQLREMIQQLSAGGE